MKEIIFLKDFGLHKKGEKAKVSIERANYWARVGVSKEYVKPKPKKKAKPKSKSKDK